MSASRCTSSIIRYVTSQDSLDLALKSLLKLTNASKKLVVNASAEALSALIDSCPHSFHPKCVAILVSAAQDKNPQTRTHAVSFISKLIKIAAEADATTSLEKSGSLEQIVRCLQKTVADAAPAVRETSRQIFDVLRASCPARAESCGSLLDSLDQSTKKTVNKTPAVFQLPKGLNPIQVIRTNSTDTRSIADTGPMESPKKQFEVKGTPRKPICSETDASKTIAVAAEESVAPQAMTSEDFRNTRPFLDSAMGCAREYFIEEYQTDNAQQHETEVSSADVSVNADASFLDGQQGLADITFDNGLVEESFFMDESTSDNPYEEMSFKPPARLMELADEALNVNATPKASKFSEPSPISGGMVGLMPGEIPENQPFSNSHEDFQQTLNTEQNASFNLDLSGCVERLKNGDETQEVFNAVFTLASQNTRGQLNELKQIYLLLLKGCMDEAKIAGSADACLTTFMNVKDGKFLFQALTGILANSQKFSEWSPEKVIDFKFDEDPNLGEYFQPHPRASVMDCLGKLLRERIKEDICDLGNRCVSVESVMELCAKETNSSRSDVRKSAVMCLVDIAMAWPEHSRKASDGGDKFWIKIGELLAPPQ
ncbi:suppressor of tub2 mutation, partial [Entophlyctis luteolus]